MGAVGVEPEEPSDAETKGHHTVAAYPMLGWLMRDLGVSPSGWWKMPQHNLLIDQLSYAGTGTSRQAHDALLTDSKRRDLFHCTTSHLAREAPPHCCRDCSGWWQGG